MSRANLALAAIAATVLLVTGSAQTQAPKPSPSLQIGRYQLLSGENAFVGRASVTGQKNVFRIDTATGETSVYTVGLDDNGKAFQEWQRIK